MNEQIILANMFDGVRVLPAVSAAPPSIDIIEGDDFYEIRSKLPGVDDDSVFVGVTDDVLTIGAKACDEAHHSFGRFLVIDHRAALVEQSFALPVDADTRSLTTSFHDGILRIVLNRSSASKVVPTFVS